MSLLIAEGVSKRVQDGDEQHVILSNVSLQIAPGERVALMGPSGSGKSTLLHILGALDPEYSGTVRVNGQTLGALSDSGLARFRSRTFGFVFQAYNLLGHLCALDNVLLPGRFDDRGIDAARGRTLLDRVGLAGKAHRRPRGLSGGERQRVAIARALYQEPKLILCDEPTGNLDRVTARGIIDLFATLSREGVAIIIATHDEAVAAHTDRMLRLDGGVLQ